MEILSIPVLRDNYIHLLHDDLTGATAAVDPPLADPVLAALSRQGWRLTHILNTHHHADHTGGNVGLQRATGCRIIGRALAEEPIPGLDQPVVDGERIELGALACVVLEVPGHTRGHVAFHFAEPRALFCGDTLFGMGCGRLLGGTGRQLWASLRRLRELPGDTWIYCAHEYTQNNGRFALTVEPGNPALCERMRRVDRCRAEGQPTVPFRLSEEWATNPFLRPESQEIRRSLGLAGADDEGVFLELRRRKDAF